MIPPLHSNESPSPVLTSGLRMDLVEMPMINTEEVGKLLKLMEYYYEIMDYLFTVKENTKETIEEKENLCEEMFTEYEELIGGKIPPEMDEACIWGVRNIRKFLHPPYFKTTDGLQGAPKLLTWSTSQAEELEEVDDELLPVQILENVQKKSNIHILHREQKWTIKDLNALRQAVREALIETHLLHIQMRTDTLLKECKSIHQEEENEKLLRREMGEEEEDDDDGNRRVKRRGRPKKFGQSLYLATVATHLFTIDNSYIGGPIVVRALVNNQQIEEWRDSEIDRINKLNMYELMKLGLSIDWHSVSNKMISRTKKFRPIDDCKYAFEYESEEMGKRWSAQETSKLKEIMDQLRDPMKEPLQLDWGKVTELMNSHRTTYECVLRARNHFYPSQNMVWTEEKEEKFKELLVKTEGRVQRAVALLGDPYATKKQVMERAKKILNPRMLSGKFSRIEDALLLLTIEKLKVHLRKEKHFGVMASFLPWRFETAWRDRASNLFADFIVPWTIAEDKLLLELVETKKRNWSEIATHFKTFKNRKGCLTRWKILQKRLKTCASVEKYHESYSMIRYNVFQYQHLQKVIKILKKTFLVPQLNNFQQLEEERPPTERELQDFLLAFDRPIMAATIISLEDYVRQRDEYYEEYTQVAAQRKRTFDRRTFNPDSSQSMASALHIREVHLIPKDKLEFELTQFQEEIYKFYAQFSTTKALKKGTKRPYLPSADQLVKMDSVKDIILMETQTQAQKRKKVVKRKTIIVESSSDESSDEEVDSESQETGNKEVPIHRYSLFELVNS